MSYPTSRPGWYPDPNDPSSQRYFDGTTWTDSRAPIAADANRSTKSSAAAGLLQLFFGWFGLGRFYIGSTAIAIVQLLLGLVGIATSPLFGLGLIVLIPLSLWTFIDAIVMFTGNINDNEGKRLK